MTIDHEAKLMNITIKEGDAGVFFATSEDEPTFFVSAVSTEALYGAIPHAIEELVWDRDHIEIAALPKLWTLEPKKAVLASQARE